METAAKATRNGPRWPVVAVIILVTVALTAGLSYWLLSRYLFVRAFKPVQLKPQEEQVLNGKLRQIGIDVQNDRSKAPPLEPERYNEEGAKREIAFSERELNAMLAKNTDLAHKLAIDLSDSLVSAKLLFPLAEDFPILGGKTLRVHAGVELSYKNSRPIVIIKGVSIMGVPIPNAWLGSLKNVDLVRQFGGDQGLWKTFADGVEYMRVTEGRLLVKLKE